MTKQRNSDNPSEDGFRYHKSDYRERHRFWAGQTLTQFGNANNFFIIIGFAILGYLVKEFDQFSNLEFTCEWEKFNSKATFLIVSLILTLLSLLSGTLTMLSRLYDLRLTRDINTIRIKSYSKKYDYDNELPNDYLDIKGKLKFLEFQIALFRKFWGSIFNNGYFLNDKDLENRNDRHRKFLDLRERTLMLGRFSWISFKW
ncbi:hypothetical protein P700755_002784 [Psychroflexus torquis ATCC 700755]|uniref:Uncharacterized protein n=1 Tax=Psychroflexus torquis (strain ATCC 700755 / CIP 106069 / ACAM 623) TaxID=313595 RepID=K4IVP1_PSYTT|nr:hypothetical protein [Psychroflexus torquis]AFU69510.1 hypothetical protein P700755_002784 [Psychroflexus torquis ATCC 700755]